MKYELLFKRVFELTSAVVISTQCIIAFLGTMAISYLLGSINFSIIASKLLGKGDLRQEGSKNAGATNLSRVAGKPTAAIVLSLDIFRAYGIVVLSSLLLPRNISPMAAIFLLSGNLFPVFHGFHGGKGVAAAVGIQAAMNPLVFLTGGAVFLAVFFSTRIVSLGSILMCLGFPVAQLLFGGEPMSVFVSAVIGLVITLTHAENISRIVRGNEPRMTGKKA